MNNLQESLKRLIAEDAMTISSLELLLSPAPIYIQNPTFLTNIVDVINIITKDRDNDQKFTINDLIVLSKDLAALSTLITTIVLLVKSLPDIKLNYKEQDTEEFIYKILVYIFLVILPTKTTVQLSQDDKLNILNVCNLIYEFLIHSGLLKEIVKKVAAWFKKEVVVCITCITSIRNRQSVVESKMPKLKAQLSMRI
ncbi:MAG TPA: hypothetical protein VLG50_07815 [Candidatus Saccharimonadales bacterium]|nr:hypothetical protein [Candidatus Saccharimonadales bacterium]